MLGFRFIKFQPSEYTLMYRNGKVIKEGAGISFYYFAPTTSIVVVPVGSVDAPFIFEEVTADFQIVTTQGQATFRIIDQKKTSQSSGILVSTGWLKSVLSGAVSIVNSMSENKIDWSAKHLYFSVLEPFPSKTSQADIVFGKVTANKPLKILSQMPENGVIFSDGIENDFLQFNSGVQATIRVAEKRGHLVV